MKLICIDDDPMVLSSLKTLLSVVPEIKLCALGASADEAVHLYRQHRPDVILLDIRMKDDTGIDAARSILALDPLARILFLTTFCDDEYIVEAMKMGAKGYILKQNYESIVPAVMAVHGGQRVFGEAVAEKLPRLLTNPPGVDAAALGLTEKELAILTHLAQGLSNREIAEAVYLSEGTVRNYISTILEKLDLRDRTQLAIFYYRTFPQG